MKRAEVDALLEQSLTSCRWGGGVELGYLTVTAVSALVLLCSLICFEAHRKPE
jgi:hypothetical protein